jgi:hypothetical protein
VVRQQTSSPAMHEWSPAAAGVGFAITVLLCSVCDLPLTRAVAVLVPAPVILGRFLRLVHWAPFPWWGIPLVILSSAVGDALWYMLIAEAFRLLVRRLDPSSR